MDSTVTAADFAVLAVLGLSALLALARGFIHEVLSVGGWVGAVFAVIFGLPLIRPWARELITLPLLADVIAGGVIFVIALIGCSFLTRAVTNRVRDSALNAVDRSLGVVFGLVRGALLVCLAYIFIEWLVPKAEQPPWILQSRSLPLVERGSGWLRSLVGAGVAESDSAADPVRRTLDSERMAREMMSPDPKSPSQSGNGAEKGYGDKERRELERLLEGNR
jgi:membrane protein required for colicin V production